MIKTVRILLAFALAVLGAGLITSAAWGMNRGSADGDDSTACAVRWRAESTINTALTNDDAEYPDLMVRPDGSPVDGYTNGGYISEVRPDVNDGPGMLEINHWYATTADTTVTPTLATPGTQVFWRIPVATNEAVTGATLTVTLPRGTDFTVTSGADIARWGAPYSDYTWTNPALTPQSSADGLSHTIYLGDLTAASGVVVQFSGRIPAGTVLSENSVARADLLAAYPAGTATCPPAPTPVSGDDTRACRVAWVTDATGTVTDGASSFADVTRQRLLSAELGDPGTFSIDGWSTMHSPVTANGRFVLATDEAITDAVWVLSFDRAIERPTVSVSTPAPAWRVDGEYREPVTIDDGVWDDAAHTLTYRLTLPANSSVMVTYAGATVAGSYVSGATYTNSATLSGSYAPGVGECAEEASPTPTPSTGPSVTPSPSSIGPSPGSPSPSTTVPASPSGSASVAPSGPAPSGEPGTDPSPGPSSAAPGDRPGPGELADTGAPAVGALLVGALALLTAGATMVVAARRR